MTDPAAARPLQKPPLRRRSWVRHGSPLWGLMCLLDGIDWIVQQVARMELRLVEAIRRAR